MEREEWKAVDGSKNVLSSQAVAVTEPKVPSTGAKSENTTTRQAQRCGSFLLHAHFWMLECASRNGEVEDHCFFRLTLQRVVWRSGTCSGAEKLRGIIDCLVFCYLFSYFRCGDGLQNIWTEIVCTQHWNFSVSPELDHKHHDDIGVGAMMMMIDSQTESEKFCE